MTLIPSLFFLCLFFLIYSVFSFWTCLNLFILHISVLLFILTFPIMFMFEKLNLIPSSFILFFFLHFLVELIIFLCVFYCVLFCMTRYISFFVVCFVRIVCNILIVTIWFKYQHLILPFQHFVFRFYCMIFFMTYLYGYTDYCKKTQI